MIKNRIVSLVYKTCLLTISFAAMFNLVYTMNSNTLAYFTNLSNILVFVIILIVWIDNLKHIRNKNYDGYNTKLIHIKGVATLCITVTFLVYAFMLANYTSKSNYTFNNLSVHYIIPIMTILDYILFDKKNMLKWYHPLIWIGCAMTYIPYIFIRAAILGSNTTLIRYPYFFLEVDRLGVFKVSMWIVGLLVFFSALAYLIFLFDKKYKEKTL